MCSASVLTVVSTAHGSLLSGLCVAQFAAAIGLEVTAISRSPEKEEEALSFGAKHFLLSSDEEAVAAAKDS